MTLKTEEKFHTEGFVPSETKRVKIIRRAMIETCRNQERNMLYFKRPSVQGTVCRGGSEPSLSSWIWDI